MPLVIINVDVHLPGELSLNQLQHISIGINAAFRDLEFPKVVVTQDPSNNTTEVELLENVAENTYGDELDKVDMDKAPLFVLIGLYKNSE